jgi:hypothetical protein
MDLRLSRYVEVATFDVRMEISRPQKRPDLIALLFRAREAQDGTNARDVCQHLLNGRPERVGQLLLKRCEELGLLQRQANPEEEPKEEWPGSTRLPSPETMFVPTREGEIAMAQREVFMPEAGRFRVWATDDPLLPAPLLSLQPRSEENPPRQGSEEQESRLEDLPDFVTCLQGQIVTLPGRDSQHRVRVDMVPRQGSRVAERARVTAEWCISDNGSSSLIVEGLLGNYSFNTKLPAPRLPWDEVWNELLGDSSVDWVPRTQGDALLSSFTDPELGDAEKRTMMRTLHFQRPELEELGAFRDTKVVRVPIAPRTKMDAQEWSEWMLEQEIARHTWPADYAKIRGDVLERFPGYGVSLPDQASLASRIEERERRNVKTGASKGLPPAYWFLRAPLDLAEDI